MYFLMYSTEGHSILYCCLRDYKPCSKQFHNWQDKWWKLSCRFESQLSYVVPFTIDNLFENLPTNLSSSLHFLFRVINGPIWWTNSVDTVVLVVRMFHLHVFKFITLSVSVMIKGLRSRRPRLASKFPYFYHVRLFIFTILTCHSAIIDSCDNLCFPHHIWVVGLGKTYEMTLLLKIIPWQLYSQTLFPILFCLHNSFKILNCEKMFSQLPFTPF